jgi:hypothetical protein
LSLYPARRAPTSLLHPAIDRGTATATDSESREEEIKRDKALSR